MNLIELLEKNLITNNTKLLDNSKIFLKTAQNSKYANSINNFVTPKDFFNLTSTKFIGITGTNGKTTTAFALSFLLRELGFKVATQGTEGFFINLEKKEPKTLTTPDIFTTIKRVFKYKADFFIMEVSSHAISQNRIENIPFIAKLFTSFSQDHLDYHKSIEEYLKVKESFFQDNSIKVIKGKKIDNFVEIDGYKFKINLNNLYLISNSLIENIKMAGEFNKINFSLALKTANILTHYPIEQLREKLETFSGVSGRMEIISNNPQIIVDFAHTPDGIKQVLNSIDNEKIVVFGAGGDRDKEKRAKMGAIAAKLAKFIIITNDNPRCENPLQIAKEISKNIPKNRYKIILDRKEAIKEALNLIKNETLLILGKGDEKFIEFCNKKEPFNDKEIVLRLLNER